MCVYIYNYIYIILIKTKVLQLQRGYLLGSTSKASNQPYDIMVEQPVEQILNTLTWQWNKNWFDLICPDFFSLCELHHLRPLARTLSGTYGFSTDSTHLCQKTLAARAPASDENENRSDTDGKVHDPNKILKKTKRRSHQCWQALTPHPEQIQKAAMVDNACPMDAMKIYTIY